MRVIISYNKYKIFFFSLLFLYFFSNISYSQGLIDAAKNINEKIQTRNDSLDKLMQDTDNGEKTIIIKDDIKSFNKNKMEKSMMLTDEEMEKVNAAIDAFLNNTSIEESGNQELQNTDVQDTEIQIKKESRVYLDAILYISKNSWIAWVNGNKITSQDNNLNNSIYIKSIERNKANIVWKIGVTKWKALTGEKEIIDQGIYKINQDSNQIEFNFTLETNQTYDLINNKIVEGKLDKVVIKKPKLSNSNSSRSNSNSNPNSTKSSDLKVNSNDLNFDSLNLEKNLPNNKNSSEISIDSLLK